MRQNLHESVLENPLIRTAARLGSARITLSASFPTASLEPATSPVIFANPTAANRTVLLPDEASSKNKWIIVVNTGSSGFDVLVRDDAASVTVGQLGQGAIGHFFCDGSTWYGDAGGDAATPFAFSQSAGALASIEALSISSGFGYSASSQFSTVIKAIIDMRAAMAAAGIADYA